MNKLNIATLIILTSFSLPSAGMAAPDPDSREVTVDQVLDGDTFISSTGEHIRIWGINAPEKDEAGFWPAGKMMDDLIRGKQISCTQMAIDRFKRTVMRCHLPDGGDIAASLTAAGWARDYRKYSNGYYKNQEVEARTGLKGIWSKSSGLSPHLKYTP